METSCTYLQSTELVFHPSTPLQYLTILIDYPVKIGFSGRPTILCRLTIPNTQQFPARHPPIGLLRMHFEFHFKKAKNLDFLATEVMEKAVDNHSSLHHQNKGLCLHFLFGVTTSLPLYCAMSLT